MNNNGHASNGAEVRRAARVTKLRQGLNAMLIKLVTDRANADFVQAVQQAYQTLGLLGHRNTEEALALLVACIGCQQRGDETSARLLLFISGAVVNDNLCVATVELIAQMTRSHAGPT